MSISVTAKERPTLRDIDFVMIYANFGINHANPVGTSTSEIPGTLGEMILK
jgi:hypothetical protein